MLDWKEKCKIRDPFKGAFPSTFKPIEKEKIYLFVDDEREPLPLESKLQYKCIVVRSFDKAVDFIAYNNFKCPEYISFDHDLGEDKTGYDLAKWLVEMDIETEGAFIPDNFNFYVHSQNPIGKENIEKYLTNYLKIRNNNV